MAPNRRLALSSLVAAGAVAALVLIATTNALGGGTCATGSWSAGTRVIAVPPPASARVSFAQGRWRLWLRHATGRALSGRVAADAGLSYVRTTESLRSRVHRSARVLSFRLPAGSSPARLSFVARCAHQIAFTLAGARILIGRNPAPASGFQILRPPTTGVAGQLLLGPTCPVVGPGGYCPSAASGVPGTVEIDAAPTIRSSAAGTPVETVSTDSNGSFSADLAPATTHSPAAPQGRSRRLGQ
jgi:hypothetical protein